MSTRSTTRPKVTTDTAFRLRHVKGLKLSETSEYEDPRIAKIAGIQAKAFEIIEQMDNRLLQFFTEKS